MKLPGFTAEASLAMPSGFYRATGTLTFAAIEPKVVPAFIRCVCYWSLCVAKLPPPYPPYYYRCPPLNCFCTKP